MSPTCRAGIPTEAHSPWRRTGCRGLPAESPSPTALEDAELAVVASPVATLRAQVAATLEASAERCTVTDVGSTKGAICATVPDRARFIGGHPVCGSESRGPEHASEELFRGATWFLTPLAETKPERYRTLHGFVASVGAFPVAVDPQAHDRLLGADQSSSARPREPPPQPGRRDQDRRARAARRGRRVAART